MCGVKAASGRVNVCVFWTKHLLTFCLARHRVHYLSFVKGDVQAQRTHERAAGTGEAVVQSSFSYTADIGEQSVRAVLAGVNKHIEEQLAGRPVTLRFELERSGRGWYKHTQGKPVPKPTIAERQQSGESHDPPPEPVYGYGACAQAIDDETGDAQAESDVRDRVRGTASRDAGKFFCDLRSEYVVITGGVSNATGQADIRDKVVLRMTPEFLPREELHPLKARSLPELLNLAHPSEYGSTDPEAIAFGPFQPHLGGVQMKEITARRQQGDFSLAGASVVRGYEAGRRGHVVCCFVACRLLGRTSTAKTNLSTFSTPGLSLNRSGALGRSEATCCTSRARRTESCSPLPIWPTVCHDQQTYMYPTWIHAYKIYARTQHQTSPMVSVHTCLHA